jgi:hypothetical protein
MGKHEIISNQTHADEPLASSLAITDKHGRIVREVPLYDLWLIGADVSSQMMADGTDAFMKEALDG